MTNNFSTKLATDKEQAKEEEHKHRHRRHSRLIPRLFGA